MNLSIVFLSLSAEYITPRPESNIPTDGVKSDFISSPERKEQSLPLEITKGSVSLLSQFSNRG
jgi:hypothetical protein